VRTERDTAELESRPSATADPAEVSGPFTHALVAVKGPETRAAVAAVAAHLEPAIVLTVQNGLGNAQAIAEVCGARICQGVTMNAGAVCGPGEIMQKEIGPTWLGPYRATREDADRWGDLLRSAGMDVLVLEDPRGAIWSKLIFNAAVNPLPVLTGLPLSRVYADPEAYALLRTLVDEGKAVARARGIALLHDPMAVIDAHRAMGEAHTHRGSMAQDVARGRPTEIDTLTGALIAEADDAGIAIPAHRTIYRLIKAVEARAHGSAGGGQDTTAEHRTNGGQGDGA
jgi:2-dehydropantoate 2-reductase